MTLFGKHSAVYKTGVNIFGIAVSTTSDDAELLARAQNANLQNKPVEEALDNALALIYECEPDADIDVTAHANIPHQQEQLANDAIAAHERFEIAHPQPVAPENRGEEASPSDLEGSSEDDRSPVAPNENAVANATDAPDVSTTPTMPDSLDAAPKPDEGESSNSPDHHKSPDEEDMANKSSEFGEHNGQAASDGAFAIDGDASPTFNADDAPRNENAIGGAPPESNGFISPPNAESPDMTPSEQGESSPTQPR